MVFTLVTREGCGLCEKAEKALQRLGLPYIRKDVDRDPELFQLYTFRVPVLLLGEEVLLEGVFDEKALAELPRLLASFREEPETEGGWTP